VNVLEEHARAIGLGDIVVTTRFEGFVVVSAQGVGGDGDDGNVAGSLIGAETLGHIISRHFGQLNVQKDEIGRRLEGDADPLLTIDRLGQLVVGLPQDVTHRLSVRRIVFDVQYASYRHRDLLDND
jgi:hypothetical protein